MGDFAGRMGESSGSVVSFSYGDTPGGTIQEQVDTVDRKMGEELQQLVDRFVSRLEKKDWENGGYYVSDVYACESVERAKGLAAKLAERARDFGRGFIGIFEHGDHVHSIHDCPYSNRCCRSFFKNFPEAKEDLRRLLRKPPSLQTLKRLDWENITKYFCQKGRRATLFKIDGVVQRLPSQITDLSNIILSSEDEGGSHPGLEDCYDPVDGDPQRKRGIEQKGDGSTRKRQRRGISNTGGPGGIGGVPGIILDIIQRYAVCPLSEIVHTYRDWETDRKSTRLNSSHITRSRMPSSA